ncbi:S-layer homology domain-containing protein [Paenibacillus apii]|uniref:S-layer homology domain-containing protein n=1 Tax=Paenibacillus apii TaxID=1850370 RepID=UPI00143AD02A|nr:S-layer homology domain-containing protein [Paenibacillus apii]NJJ39833.1 S-layer homology domain-containing protein [Paenibacillus apii]
MNIQTFRHSAKKMTIACGILAASVSFGASAFAFSDLKGDPAEAKINALHEAGVINGVTSQLFAPKSKMTYGQAVQLIVSGLALKQNPVPGSPSKASDYFAKVDDKSWYAPSLLIAVQNGLPLDKTLLPNAAVSRAHFAQLLDAALRAKGDFPVTKMYFNIADGGKLSAEADASLQTLLNMRIISLEPGGKFRPDDAVTRSEAAAWVHDARAFVERMTGSIGGGEDSTGTNPAAELKVEKIADGVNKVSVTVGNLPNPGYGLTIARIEFGDGQKAVIYYEITNPGSGIYPQVISKATAVAYLPEGYTASTKPLPGSYTPPEPDNPQL